MVSFSFNKKRDERRNKGASNIIREYIGNSCNHAEDQKEPEK
jgi:hypothetical protein